MSQPTQRASAGNDVLRIRYLGGPTAVIEIGGLRLVTDPTFDPPGDHPVGNRVLTKTSGPTGRRPSWAALAAGGCRSPACPPSMGPTAPSI